LYEQYYEIHFVQGNEEMMHIFKEHSDYKNSNALVVRRLRKSYLKMKGKCTIPVTHSILSAINIIIKNMSRTHFQSYLFLSIFLGAFLFVGNTFAATCAPTSLTQVSFGQSGANVANLQQCLIDAGYGIPAGATGYYGAQTQTAVKEFYRARLNIGDWDGNSVGPQGRSQLGVSTPTPPRQSTQNKPTGEATSKEYSYKKVASKDELLSYIDTPDTAYYATGIGAADIAEESFAPSAPTNAVARNGDESSDVTKQASRVSTTNVQVSGIDEPDVVKTDGESIFISPRANLYHRDVFTTMAVDSATDERMMPPVNYVAPTTKVVDAFPLSELSLISKDAIKESGEMLLVNNMLLIFTYENIVAYDITDPENPKKKWDRKYGENVQLTTARAKDGVVYVVTATYLRRDRPCPVVPLIGAGMTLPCSSVWVPEHLENLNTSYSILALDPRDGTVEKDITLAGKADNTVVAMFEDNVYVTHRESGGRLATMLDFLEFEAKDLLAATTVARITTIRGYDISDESKIQEIEKLVETEMAGKSDNEALRIQTEIQNRMQDYLTKHMRDIDRTVISRIAVDTLTIKETKSIPGHLLNQFSLDEYNGYVRLAVTVGERWGGGTQVNDVYVLNGSLEIVGRVLDLGFTEQVYSARFIGDRGYVVTFRQIDPFYVFDLSDPLNPKMTGELKIPGYSSYLEAIDRNTVLGVGRDGGNVKLSLFDVSNPALPVERSVYTLTESWSEVENNHHAFLRDSQYKVVFIPASNGGYVISYENNKLSLKAAVSGYDVRRAVFIDEYFYVVGDEKITVLNENTWKEEKTLSL
jgi:inhibitor of cysteine peptidase